MISTLGEHFSYLQHFDFSSPSHPSPLPSSSSSSSSRSLVPPSETLSFLKSLLNCESYIRNICTKGREDQANISVLYNADFCSFQLNLKKGVIANFQFDIPRNAKKNPRKWLEGKGKRFFSNTQIGIFYDLEKQSFCFVVPEGDSPKIIEGSKFQMDFCIPSTEEGRFGKLIHSHLQQTSTKFKIPHKLPSRFIFLVPSIFFPMIVPILSGLQNLNARILPFDGTLSQMNFKTVENIMVLPPYLQYKRIDFSAILASDEKEGFPPQGSVRQTIEDASKFFGDNPSFSCLDKGQLNAFFRCLSQKIAVIQGPPGTGKSFLGVKLLKTVLQNSNARNGPVLVVCYTNHALDQFLRDLLEGRAVRKEDIVRIGGQCKDPLLDQCSFFRRIRNNTEKGKRSRSTIFRLRQEASELESKLSNWVMIRKMNVSFSILKEFVDKHLQEIKANTPCKPLLSYIFARKDEDGFDRGKKPSKIYDDLVKNLSRYAKKQEGRISKLLFDVSEGQPSFPPGRPCPLFLSSTKNKCREPCENGSHAKEWKQFQNQICFSWLRDGVCNNRACPRVASHSSSLAPLLSFPVDELGPPCPFYVLKGDCKKGDSCEFSHNEAWRKYEKDLCFHYLLRGSCNAGVSCLQRRGHNPILRDDLEDNDQGTKEKAQAKKMREDDIKRKIMETSEEIMPLTSELDITRELIQEFFPEWKGFSSESFHGNNQLFSSSSSSYSFDSWRGFDGFSQGKQLAMYLILRETVLSLYLAKWTKLIEDYYRVMAEYEEAHLDDNITLLKSAKVIGVTTSGAAKSSKLLTGVKAQVMIVEEAGEVLESHLLTSLTKHVEHLILIGDHQQLRPKINTYRLKGESGMGYNLDCSTFERMVEGEFPFSTLSVQYRMYPSIADLIRPLYSPNIIQDGENVRKYPSVRGMKERAFFFDHNYLEDQAEGASDLSKVNTKEAEMAVGLALYLMHNEYVGNRLALITPYVGQLLKIRSILSSKQIKIVMNDLDEEEVLRAEEGENGAEGGLPDKLFVGSANKHLRLATVDNFQGEEADVVIVSTVRCNHQGRIGFLKFDNRVNVMFSRARHGMYVLGSRATVERFEQKRRDSSAKPCFFSDIVHSFEEKKLIGSKFECQCDVHETITAISVPSDWKKVNEGGCDLECGQKLPCGHACPRPCHSNDREHTFHQCRKKCMKMCAAGKHPCSGMCYQSPCPPCRQKTTVSLVCGHDKRVVCSQQERAKCDSLVSIELPWCGHSVKLPCHQAQEVKKNPHKVLSICTQICDSKLPCGHNCANICGNCTKASSSSTKKSDTYRVVREKHPPCSHRCDRPLECSHNCEGTCHKQGQCPPCKKSCTIICDHTKCSLKCIEPCTPCTEDCSWFCEHQGKCITTCGSPCVRLPCDLRCKKTLECGHQCPSVCGERCPSRKFCVECGDMGDRVVDFIMFSTYNDVKVDEDPVCVLECGHLYTISFLDGLLQMDQMFLKDEEGKWVGFLPFSDFDDPRPLCPECNQPIHSLRRYGRYIKWVSLLGQRKRHYQYFRELSVNYAKRVKGAIDNQSERKGGEIEKICNILIPPAISKRAQSKFDVFSRTSEAARTSCLRAVEEVQEWEKAIFVPSPILGVEFELVIMKFRERLFRLYGAVAVLIYFLEDLDKIIEEKKGDRAIKLIEICRSMFSVPLLAYPSPLSSTSPFCREEMSEESVQEEFVELTKEWIHQFIERDIPIFHAKGTELKFSKKIAEMMDEAANVLFATFSLIGKCLCKERSNFRDSLRTFSKWAEKNENAMSPKSFENLKKGIALLEKQYSDVFYEKVTDDELRKVLQAGAADWGSAPGSFGRFRECPNGHMYVIGECGGAMHEAECPECGAKIGGGNHQHAEGTRDSSRALAVLGAPGY